MAGEEILAVTFLAIASIVITMFVAVVLKKKISALSEHFGYLDAKVSGLEEAGLISQQKLNSVNNIIQDKPVAPEETPKQQIEVPPEVVAKVKQPIKKEEPTKEDDERVAKNKETVTAIINLQTQMLKELEKLKL